MKTPLMMIINPAAGKGAFEKGLAEGLKLLSDADYDVSIYFTHYTGHAAELAAEHGPVHKAALILGGDGTLGEAIAGLMELPRTTRPQVGYIPIGTANDIARTLGLPKGDIREGVRRFLNGTVMPFDTGRRDGGYFNYVAAFGAFTKVSYATPQKYKKKYGELAYLVEALKSLNDLKSRHVRVEYDGGEFEGSFLYGGVHNSYSVGGIVPIPKDMVDLGDGLYELILIKELPDFAALVKLARQVLGGRLDSEYIVLHHTKTAKFHFDEPTPWTLDGEEGAATLDAAFENCPQSVEIIC